MTNYYQILNLINRNIILQNCLLDVSEYFNQLEVEGVLVEEGGFSDFYFMVTK